MPVLRVSDENRSPAGRQVIKEPYPFGYGSLRLSKNLAGGFVYRAAGELEGKIPPAGEMSAKLTKGARIKARLELDNPPSEKLDFSSFSGIGVLPSAKRSAAEAQSKKSHPGLF